MTSEVSPLGSAPAPGEPPDQAIRRCECEWGKTILIVEDDIGTLHLLQQIIQRQAINPWPRACRGLTLLRQSAVDPVLDICSATRWLAVLSRSAISI